MASLVRLMDHQTNTFIIDESAYVFSPQLHMLYGVIWPKAILKTTIIFIIYLYSTYCLTPIMLKSRP